MLSPATGKPFLFVCASDTLVKLMLPVAQALQAGGHRVCFATLQFTTERAEFELGQNVQRDAYVGVLRHDVSWLGKFQALVIGNDWGREIRAAIFKARRARVPSICLQESVIDFKGSIGRMRHADYALVQGLVSSRHLTGRKNIVVVGNPRYETLQIAPAHDGQAPVLLNCNFTYGVEEDCRDTWLKAAIGACKASKRNVLVLQHPRDTADLAKYGVPVRGTSAASIHGMLRQGSAVITRFSSLIHEAIALGRPAIYFNPHKESVGYDFGPACAVLKYASSESELTAALSEFQTKPPSAADFEAYVRDHFRPLDALPSEACASAIVDICTKAQPMPSVPFEKITTAYLLAYTILERLLLLKRGRL